MIPAQKPPKTKKKKKEKTPKEKEVESQVIMQKQKPLLPVDEMEFDKGLKPTSKFYGERGEEKISGAGGDDDNDDKGKKKKDDKGE